MKFWIMVEDQRANMLTNSAEAKSETANLLAKKSRAPASINFLSQFPLPDLHRRREYCKVKSHI